MTFDRPIEVPGATLQPGTYWFELIDSPASRHTVKISNASESEVITTAQAVPIERTLDKVKGDTVLALNPTDSSATAALDAWFYPGQVYGHEFIYPKDQARQIAQRTRRFVLADEDGKTYRIGGNGEHEEWVADARSKDAWERMHASHHGEHDAVGTSGTAGRMEKREVDGRSAGAHLEALERMLDDALKGSGATVSIDRAKLMEMRAHVEQLQREIDTKK